jgi:peroxiredoxin
MGLPAIGGLVIVAACGRASDAVGVGSRAPEFEARTITSPVQLKHLSDYRGSVVLLNVWATWCDPCREEMPSIEHLYRELGPRGLRIVAVSIDDGGAEPSIRDFVKEYGLTFEILHDPTGRIMRTYQMVGVPATFLIDAGGTIRRKTFPEDWSTDQNRASVEKLLAAKQ